MATTFENSQIAKALKMKGGLRTLANEYLADGAISNANLLKHISRFPVEELAKLYDLIQRHELPSAAAAELAMSDPA